MAEYESRPEAPSELERQLRADPFSPKRGMDMRRAGQAVESAPTPAPQPPVWNERETLTLTKIKQQKGFSVGWKILAGIVGILLVTTGIVLWQRSAFHAENVIVKVEAPTAADAVQDVEFTVSYANNNRVDLTNAELVLYYPSGFTISKLGPNMAVDGAVIRMKIGTITGHAQSKVTMTGKFFGGRDSLAYLKAVLHYTPSAQSTTLETSSQASVALRSSALAVDIDTPLAVAAGSMVEYLVTATNTSDTPLSNMRLQMTLPDGFVPSDASPKPSEGNSVWYIGTIDPHQKLSFRTSGMLNGVEGATKILNVDFGTIQSEGTFVSMTTLSRSTKLVPSPLAISQTVNGVTKMNVHPGDRLAYVLTYRNQGSTPLRNIILTFEMHSTLFDLAQVQADGGSYDAQHQTITWKASDHPQLALLNPGETGSIQFTVPLLRQWDTQSVNGVNPVVVTVAKVDSLDIPTPLGSNKIVASNRLTIPVASAPSLAVEVSPVPVLPNAGVLATNERQFIIRLLVTNTSNVLKDARVKALLATNVHWLQAESAGSEHVIFDDRANAVTWDLGGVDANTTTRSASFQVSFTPAPDQIRNMSQSLLLNDKSIVLTATDTFTQEPVQVIYQPSVGVFSAK